MLVVDPLHRISVEEALRHPYVYLWYDRSEVEAPAPGRYDASVECAEHTVEDWKKLIFEQIKRYEAAHDIYAYGKFENDPNQEVGNGEPT
jgi:hypothetical protein